MNPRGFACLALYRPKCDTNVGGVLRAAYAYRASMVVCAKHRYNRAPTDTPNAGKHMPFLQVDDLMSTLPTDCVPVAVEIVPSARTLFNYQHPQRAFYVFGPEDGTLPLDIINACRDIVYIPGRMCMNLAATANVILYDRLCKQSREEKSLALGLLSMVG